MPESTLAPAGDPVPSDARPDPDIPPPEIVEFIRFCHRRRSVGWPELYDEMWAVAARHEFNGWGEEQFAAYGVTFSLYSMPRLSAWVRLVIADPRTAGDRPLAASAAV